MSFTQQSVLDTAQHAVPVSGCTCVQRAYSSLQVTLTARMTIQGLAGVPARVCPGCTSNACDCSVATNPMLCVPEDFTAGFLSSLLPHRLRFTSCCYSLPRQAPQSCGSRVGTPMCLEGKGFVQYAAVCCIMMHWWWVSLHDAVRPVACKQAALSVGTSQQD